MRVSTAPMPCVAMSGAFDERMLIFSQKHTLYRVNCLSGGATRQRKFGGFGVCAVCVNDGICTGCERVLRRDVCE